MNVISEKLSNKLALFSIVSAILVVFIHSFNLVQYGINSGFTYWFEQIISQYLARAAVPFFFISSSFFLFRKENVSTPKLYKSKFHSIFVPYLFWNTAYLISLFVLGKLALTNRGGFDLTIGNIFAGIFLYKYNYTFWFMYKLIIFTLLYPVINKIIKFKKIYIVILVFVFLALIFLGDAPDWSSYKTLSFEATFYYLLGGYIGRYCSDRLEEFNDSTCKKKLLILFISFVSSLTLFILNHFLNIFWLQNLEAVQNILVIVMWFILFDFVPVNNARKSQNLSFLIYCIHPIVLEAFQKITFKFLPKTQWFAWVDYIIPSVITIALIWLTNVIIKKAPKIYAIICGGR